MNSLYPVINTQEIAVSEEQTQQQESRKKNIQKLFDQVEYSTTIIDRVLEKNHSKLSFDRLSYAFSEKPEKLRDIISFYDEKFNVYSDSNYQLHQGENLKKLQAVDASARVVYTNTLSLGYRGWSVKMQGSRILSFLGLLTLSSLSEDMNKKIHDRTYKYVMRKPDLVQEYPVSIKDVPENLTFSYCPKTLSGCLILSYDKIDQYPYKYEIDLKKSPACSIASGSRIISHLYSMYVYEKIDYDTTQKIIQCLRCTKFKLENQEEIDVPFIQDNYLYELSCAVYHIEKVRIQELVDCPKITE